MNPLLDTRFFIPDGEAHVMPDGRLYIYGSKDIPYSDGYCCGEYNVFSTADMKTFVNHGVSFTSQQTPWNKGGILFAPDCVYKNGRYWLYFCMSDNTEGVAVSDSPTGPFEDASEIDTLGLPGIDPAVFTDDDGKTYYFWGQFELNGAVLNEDMRTLDPSTLKTCIITDYEHGFHEGASIRKRNGIYYLVYTDISRGRATCMSYATATSPLGPYTKRGVIIDNTGSDPNSWNDHGSIECLNGQWYVFYHRATNNCDHCRRICAEPIFFDENGLISEVPMTTSGPENDISARRLIPASFACRMAGPMYIKPDGNTEYLTNCAGRYWIKPWAEYKYLHFDGKENFCMVTVRGSGSVSLKAEGINKRFGTDFECSEFSEISFPIDDLSSSKRIWFSFSGKDVEFLNFTFITA